MEFELIEIAIDEKIGPGLRALIIDDTLDAPTQLQLASLCRAAFVRGAMLGASLGRDGLDQWARSLGYYIKWERVP